MHMSARLYRDKPSLPLFGTNARRVWLLLALLFAACTKQELPDLGPRLPQTAALELSPSLLGSKAEYTDNCGHLQIVELGTTLQDMLYEEANRTFASVVRPGSDVKPDVVLRVNLVQSNFTLRMDGIYDRAETDIRLGGLVSVVNQGGTSLGEQEVQVAHKGRVRIQPIQKNCDYLLDEFIGGSAREFAHKVAEASRAKLASTGATPTAPGGMAAGTTTAAVAPAMIPVPAPPRPAATGGAGLSFKATVLDDNGNLVFEGGERIRVRVDVVNTGSQELHNVTATLSGAPLVLAQFPASTLSAGRLQPGQSRSIEFVATLPQGMQPQKADLVVTVADPAAAAPSAQTVSLSIQPSGLKADDVDQVPAMAVGYKRPHTYLISIGIGSYRDQQLSLRKYAASDAELLTNYFQSLGGLPSSNIRLLQDWKALRPDIDEALLDWLPGQMNKEAVVIVYFAGLATVSPNGDVYLIPYDGSLTTSSRSYPLKDLEAALNRLKAKHTLFVFDGVVARMGGGTDSRSKPVFPQWNPSGSSTVHLLATNGVGKVVEDEEHRHGLFTYYLLRALRGESDANHDGEVTLGEAVAYLNQKVLWASKTRHGQEQRPAVVPPLKATDQATGLPLTKLAAVAASERP
ncbi:MAG TPA: caspase family protein [Nitrospira sp.]|nr:caspase family protein [Nitrospira sp.]